MRRGDEGRQTRDPEKRQMTADAVSCTLSIKELSSSSLSSSSLLAINAAPWRTIFERSKFISIQKQTDIVVVYYAPAPMGV